MSGFLDPEARPVPRRRLRLPAFLGWRGGLALSGLSASSAGSFAVLVTGAGVSYVAQVVTARIVGGENFGVYVYALSWMVIAATVSTLGLHVSLLRLVAGYRAAGDWAAIRGVLRFAVRRVAVAGALVALCGAAVTLAAGLGAEPRTTMLIALAAAPVVALQLVGAALVRSFGSVVASLMPERLGRDFVAVLVLAALVWLGLAPATAPTAISAMMASALVMLAVTVLLARRSSPVELAGAPPRPAGREWMRPALPLTVIMGADVVMARSGVVVLGLLGDARGAGIFAVGFSLAVLTALPRMAVAAGFAPMVASLHATGDRAGLQALLGRAARLSLAGSICVAVPLLVAMPLLLGLFGPGFSQGAPATAILVGGQLVAAAAGPQQHLMTMTGNERAGAAMHAGSALLGLVLCFPLSAWFGFVGTAAGIATAVVVWNLAMAWFAFARLGLRPGLFAAPAAPV